MQMLETFIGFNNGFISSLGSFLSLVIFLRLVSFLRLGSFPSLGSFRLGYIIIEPIPIKLHNINNRALFLI